MLDVLVDEGILLENTTLFNKGEYVNIDIIYLHNGIPAECKISLGERCEKIPVRSINIFSMGNCKFYEM